MATNRKRIPRSRKPSGLTPAQHFFVYGKEIGRINSFEMLDLEYPVGPAQMAKVEKLKKYKI